MKFEKEIVKSTKEKELYFNILNDIKNEIYSTRSKIVENTNKELILLYYDIGLKLIKASQYGTSYIDTLAKDLKIEFPNMRGMSARNLRYMKKFATEFSYDDIVTYNFGKLTWTSLITIMDRVKGYSERLWYINQSLDNDWTVTVLVHQISTKLYERQAIQEYKVNNFNNTLPFPNNERVTELLKETYIFDFITSDRDAKELDIETELTNNITKLLLELGKGFTFVGRQYHLEIEDEDYYIDLLFYNLKVKSYVVIELKTTSFKPEYIGKLNFYLNAVDMFVKGEADNPTFGILLCKGKKKVTAELSLKDINKPIGISEYKTLTELPEYLENTLPSIDEIEKRLQIM